MKKEDPFSPTGRVPSQPALQRLPPRTELGRMFVAAYTDNFNQQQATAFEIQKQVRDAFQSCPADKSISDWLDEKASGPAESTFRKLADALRGLEVTDVFFS